MTPKIYDTDLSDAEWVILGPLPEPPTRRGRPRRHALRVVINAILYVLRGGVPWRLLPRDFPPWRTVYDQFRRWRRAGAWRRINAALRGRARRLAGRRPQPTAAIIDGQSVRTSEAGGARGYDGGKRVSGRKRHLVVDTQGLVLHARVPRRVSTTAAPPRSSWPKRARRSPRSSACSPTWATRAWRPGSPRGSAGSWRSSGGPGAGRGCPRTSRRPSTRPASTSCPSGGSSSAPSPGSAGAAA
jgi:transposase